MQNDAFAVLENSKNRASGRCNKFQTYISTSAPSGESAIEELERLFEQHFIEMHSDEP
jgi:hypothetical protein